MTNLDKTVLINLDTLNQMLPKTDQLITIQEAASVFGVSTKTLRRWEAAGKLVPQRTSGGHRRYFLSEVKKLKRAGKKNRFKTIPATSPAQEFNFEVIKTLNQETKSFSAPLVTPFFEAVATEQDDFEVIRPARRRPAIGFVFLGLGILLLLTAGGRSLISNVAEKENGNNTKDLSKIEKQESPSVLAIQTSLENLTFNVNVPSNFAENVNIDGDITTNLEVFNFLPENATTINIGGTTGITNINNNLAVAGDIDGDSDLNIVGVSTLPTIVIGEDTLTELVGTGLSISGTTLQTTLGTSISASELESSNTPTNGQVPTYNSSTGGFTWANQPSSGASGITGTGTANALAKFTGASTIADSGITDDGTTIGIASSIISFDDATLTSAITLTDVDSVFDSGDTAIVDAINTAYNAAIGSSAWTITAGVLHPTDTTNDLAIGGTTTTSSMFGIDESAGNFYFGYDNSASPTLNFEASDGDAGEIAFTTNDTFAFNNASISTTGNLSVAGATGITMSNTASSLTFGNGESINNTIDGRLTLVAPSVSFNSGGR